LGKAFRRRIANRWTRAGRCVSHKQRCGERTIRVANEQSVGPQVLARRTKMKASDCYWCSHCNGKAWVRNFYKGQGRCENYYSRAPDSYLKSGPEAQCGEVINEVADFVTWITFSGEWQCACGSRELLVTAEGAAQCRSCKSVVNDRRLHVAIRRGLRDSISQYIFNLVGAAILGALVVAIIAYFAVSKFWAGAAWGALLGVMAWCGDILSRKRSYSRDQTKRLFSRLEAWEGKD
jgi:hypothetical protein